LVSAVQAVQPLSPLIQAVTPAELAAFLHLVLSYAPSQAAVEGAVVQPVAMAAVVQAVRDQADRPD